MPLRVTQDSTKIGYVVLWYFAGFVGLLSVGIAWGTTAVSAAGLVASVLAVGIAVRVFRGDGEPVAPPRAWWRMTARPTSGFVFAALFGAQAVSTAVAARADGDGWLILSAAISLLIGAMFLQSSLRLRARTDRTATSVP
ncbi:hypothetical protein [Pengzhenrongella sicca]|uniref:Uncharacterized protein n=1 Tax=Pengzhenrongella sicca TaxID=2819238 RepID=A0A8A4ZEQ7_9MICO|nr:hypothetical protein [Pengzhenrongella sicca]QTE30384.1 hypothetical protein J4E96_05160 [Pengzhenrongella sicca]